MRKGWCSLATELAVSGADAVFRSAIAVIKPDLSLVRKTELVPEASARRYYRLELSDASTLVGVLEDAASARVNMLLFANIRAFLAKASITVPEILFTDAERGVMLQQDLGDLNLMEWLKLHPDQREACYQEAIQHMLLWQRLADDGECPAFRLRFDVDKFVFEFDYFIEHALRGFYGVALPPAELTYLRASFFEVAQILTEPPNKVFTHRDYHSRNIMVMSGPRSAEQFVIDFQDARLGLMQYDLASLLCDSYAPMDCDFREKLLDFAFGEGKDVHQQSRTRFNRFWAFSAFQRIVKAMGTFGKMAALGRKDFAPYFLPAWRALDEVSRESPPLKLIAQLLIEMCSVRSMLKG